LLWTLGPDSRKSGLPDLRTMNAWGPCRPVVSSHMRTYSVSIAATAAALWEPAD